MGYLVQGVELETDADGYLLEANFTDEVVEAIAADEGVALTPEHWEVIRYLRDEYQENGHSAEFPEYAQGLPGDSPGGRRRVPYDLFPLGPASRAPEVAGLRNLWQRDTGGRPATHRTAMTIGEDEWAKTRQVAADVTLDLRG